MKKHEPQPLFYFFRELGGVTLFVAAIGRTLLTTRGNVRPIIAQMADVFTRSFSIVIFSGIFVGAILVLQFNLMLKQFDAQIFLGGLNTSAVVREVGPLIISFLLAGKIGAFTAAELGTMRVTEQIDAIECLGMNSMQYLILPRFIAIIAASVILLVFSLVVSIGGAMTVAGLFCNVNPLQFILSIPRFTDIWTVASGLFKSLVFGIIVASVACYKGYTVTGGARGVGRAVTWGAVYISLYIVIADFLTSHVMRLFYELFGAVGST